MSTNNSHDSDVSFIRALAELLRENDLTELQVKRALELRGTLGAGARDELRVPHEVRRSRVVKSRRQACLHADPRVVRELKAVSAFRWRGEPPARVAAGQ